MPRPKHDPPPDGFVPVSRAARALGLPYNTVSDWALKGFLAVERRGGRRYTTLAAVRACRAERLAKRNRQRTEPRGRTHAKKQTVLTAFDWCPLRQIRIREYAERAARREPLFGERVGD